MSSPLLCPKCFTPFSAQQVNTGLLVECAACGSKHQISVFPAFFREVARGNAGETAVAEGQATCFYHPQKTADVPCDGCGRFICALCDIELHGQHLCPACVDSGRRKGDIVTLENRRVIYDNVALSLAIVPLLMWPLTILTAPATIVFCIWAWKKPRGIVARRRTGFVAAIFFSLCLLAGWGVFFFYLLRDLKFT